MGTLITTWGLGLRAPLVARTKVYPDAKVLLYL